MPTRFNVRPRVSAAIALALLAACGGARADDPVSVTPYRPSVSTPAGLSAPGWLEVEAGLQSSHGDDPARRDSLPYTLKLAFTPDWGVRVGGDAFVHQRDADGTHRHGGGDTGVVLKRRFAVDEASAFGLELGAKIPTARIGLGSGHTDVGLNGIYSTDVAEGWHFDANLVATHLGGVEDGTSAWQMLGAGAVTRTINEQWSLIGEVSGTRQRGNPSTGQALVATSYLLSPAVALDIGVSRGFNATSGGWTVFTGITFLAARLF